MAQRYLICVDESIWSHHAFSTAKQFILKDKGFDVTDQVYILYVSNPVTASFIKSATVSGESMTKLHESAEAHARKVLMYYSHQAESLHKKGVEVSLLRAIGNRPAVQIQHAVEFYNIDQVFVGRGSPSLYKKLFLGSVSRAVMESVDAIVTVVKKPVDDFTEKILEDRIRNEKIERIWTDDKISEFHPFALYVVSPSSTEVLEQIKRSDAEMKNPVKLESSFSHSDSNVKKPNITSSDSTKSKSKDFSTQQTPIKEYSGLADSTKSKDISTQQPPIKEYSGLADMKPETTFGGLAQEEPKTTTHETPSSTTSHPTAHVHHIDVSHGETKKKKKHRKRAKKGKGKKGTHEKEEPIAAIEEPVFKASQV